MLTIHGAQVDKAVLLTVTGRMDADNAPEFQRVCEVWIALGVTRFIADLGGLEYVSSMGLRSFLGVAQTLQSSGGSLSLCHVRGLPRQVFELTNLLRLFPVFETPEQAVAAI